MAEPFLGEIKMVGFNFPPRGWAYCDGQLLPINQNQALFSLLGTTYGGDGRTTFGLPDLRGRVPIHPSGTTHRLGQKSGEETHTLSVAEMPSHTHVALASADSGNTPVPNDHVLAAANNLYQAPGNLTSLGPNTLSTVGGQSHQNMQPFLTLSFCIALQGIFPSRN